jgi:hypothetical protein
MDAPTTVSIHEALMTASSGRPIARTILAGLVFLFVRLPGLDAEGHFHGELVLDLEVTSSLLNVGEPLDLTVRYESHSDQPFFLFRDANLGSPGHLEIRATKGGCIVNLPETHVYMPPDSARFFFFPLMQGRALEERVRVNDARRGFLAFPLRSLGTYEVQATFVSDKTDSRPVWRGTALSKRVTIRLEGPKVDSLAGWRASLARCLAGDCQKVEGAINYFTIVRDPEAAELLSTLLRNNVLPSVVDAVVAQRRREDAAIIREYAKNVPVASQRSYYERAALEAGQADPCQ